MWSQPRQTVGRKVNPYKVLVTNNPKDPQDICIHLREDLRGPEVEERWELRYILRLSGRSYCRRCNAPIGMNFVCRYIDLPLSTHTYRQPPNNLMRREQ